MIAFTECLALDLVGTQVKVQALCTAWITTDFVQGHVTSIPSVKARIAVGLIGSGPGRWLLSQLRQSGIGVKAHAGRLMQPYLFESAATICFSTMLQIKCHARRWHS